MPDPSFAVLFLFFFQNIQNRPLDRLDYRIPNFNLARAARHCPPGLQRTDTVDSLFEGAKGEVMPWVSILLYGSFIPAAYAGYQIAGGWGACAAGLWTLVAVDLVHAFFEWIAGRGTEEVEPPITKGALRSFVWFVAMGAVCWYFTDAWVALSLVGGLVVGRSFFGGILSGMVEEIDAQEETRAEEAFEKVLDVLRANGLNVEEIEPPADTSEEALRGVLHSALEPQIVEIYMKHCGGDGDHAAILSEVSEASAGAFEITDVTSQVDEKRDDVPPTVRVQFTHEGVERRWKFVQQGGWLDPVFLEAIAAYCAEHTAVDFALFDISDESTIWLSCDKSLAAALEELGAVKRYAAIAGRKIDERYEDLGGTAFSAEALHTGGETLQAFFKERSMASMARDPEKALVEMAEGFMTAANSTQATLDEEKKKLG